MNAAQKARARLERAVAVSAPVRRGEDHDLDDLIGDDAYAEAVDWAKRTGIPQEAIERYGEAHLWAAENPDKAEMLLSWDDQQWAGILTGMGYPDLIDLPDDELQMGAWQLRTWAILTGTKFLYDWTQPIAMMTEDDIIAQVRQDALDGKIPEPRMGPAEQGPPFTEDEYAQLAEQHLRTGGRTPTVNERQRDAESLLRRTDGVPPES